LRWIDPHGRRFGGWFGGLFDEALGIRAEGAVQCALAGGVDGFGLAVMDLIGCHQAETGMVMVLIVP
jgi:hypothetical protein